MIEQVPNKIEKHVCISETSFRIDLRDIKIGLIEVAYIDDGRFALILEKPRESIKEGESALLQLNSWHIALHHSAITSELATALIEKLCSLIFPLY